MPGCGTFRVRYLVGRPIGTRVHARAETRIAGACILEGGAYEPVLDHRHYSSAAEDSCDLFRREKFRPDAYPVVRRRLAAAPLRAG
jgi:hypothetical protein